MDSSGITLTSKNGDIILDAGNSVENKVKTSSAKVEARAVTLKAPTMDISADSVTQVKGSILDLN